MSRNLASLGIIALVIPLLMEHYDKFGHGEIPMMLEEKIPLYG